MTELQKFQVRTGIYKKAFFRRQDEMAKLRDEVKRLKEENRDAKRGNKLLLTSMQHLHKYIELIGPNIQEERHLKVVR